jgi:aminopeptidase N
VVDGKYESVHVTQEAPLMPAGSKELRIHRLAIGLYDIKDDKVVLRKSVKFDLEGPSTEIAELAGEPVAELLLVNDQDLSYGKVRLDERSISTLKSHIGKIEDGLTRVVCWSAAWDMLRDAELSAADFLQIIQTGLPGESDITTVTTLGNQIYGAIENYSPIEKRSERRVEIANFIDELLKKAEPGSDMQLQLTRILVTMSDSAEQTERVRDLLNGKLPGLTVDVDLRWTFLKFLAEKGAVDISEIEAELTRDNTFSGNLSYLDALAEIPNIENKRKVWDSIIHDDLATEVRKAKISGFISYRNHQLLEEFVDKYFEMIVSVWGKQSYEVGESIVEGLFPAFITKQSTLDKADAWLNGPGKDAPDTLKRLVNEGRDGLARALRVQAIDA